MNQINDTLIKLVKHYEGKGGFREGRFYPYLCPTSHATLAYGHVIYENGKEVSMERANELYPNGISEKEADDLLRSDLIKFSEGVRSICIELGLKFDDNKFSALTDFAYNCGIGALKRVLTRYKQGLNMATLLKQYRFGTVNGVKTELKGLALRRYSETLLFQEGKLNIT